MNPWFIATEKFGPSKGEAWRKYLTWSGLTHLQELVSLDPILCPPILSAIREDYWPHIVNENFMLSYFVDLDFLLAEVSNIIEKNVLCVFRNPVTQPRPPIYFADSSFLGYDLVDVEGSASALSNCGGFPEVSAPSELSSHGLLITHIRASEVQADLRTLYPNDHHANCHIWAIFRSLTY